MAKKNRDETEPRIRYERVRLDTLTQDPQNVRKHSERNMAAIAASLTRFGQQHPILVDANGVILAGNGRAAAMVEMGWEFCDVARTELAGDEARAFAIADNRTSELAEWDSDALAEALASIDLGEDFGFGDLGFDQDEIDRMIGTDTTRGACEYKGGFDKSEEEYRAAETRAVVLYYGEEDYETVVAKMDAVMEANDLLSHAEALQWLCERA
jgi:hypothetical protein